MSEDKKISMTNCLRNLVQVMIEAGEYHSVIKFLVLRHVPSDQISLFKHGRQSVFDDQRTGRPCEISEKIKEKSESLPREDRRIITWPLAEAVNVSNEPHKQSCMNWECESWRPDLFLAFFHQRWTIQNHQSQA
jgi:hypothetical protein